MRKYGRVETAFWQNKKVRRLSEDGRTLAFYLLTCPHGNGAGCFVLPPAYISSDLGWAAERVEAAMTAVINGGFVQLDAEIDLIRLIGWWGHNPIDNPNVAKHIVTSLLALPKSALRTAAIREVRSLEGLSEKVSEAFRNGFQTVSETLSEPTSEPAEGFRNKEHNITDTEQKQIPRDGGGKVYAFTGKVIRLTPADFETWRKAYHAIPDLVAELTTIDAKFYADPPADWFGTASAWLGSKHQRLIRERTPPERIPASRRTMN